MTVHRFRVDALLAVPWKNGGGTMRQAVCWPPGSGLDDFEWRVSMAEIASSGPFSPFPGVDRHILLSSGDGMRLRADDGSFDHRLDRLYSPFSFPGDVAVQSEMLGGESRDFNVMVRRGRCRARMSVLDEAGGLDAAAHGLLLAVTGAWRADGEMFDAGTGLWWAGAPHAWRLVPEGPGAKLIAVCLSDTGQAGKAMAGGMVPAASGATGKEAS